MVEGQRRLLIVSDMHLGRDCKEITGFQRTTRPDDKFDQAFIDMLDYYTQDRESEWRLIFGGDFIDFVEVMVVPEARGPLDLLLTFEVTDEERAYGLGSEAERGLIKLDKTFEYHERFFTRLAAFVRRGGEIVIVRGNHDAEFHWKKVQRVFRRRLADIAFTGQALELDDLLEQRNVFQGRISFAPWIYVEPGRLYLEHGHQYDVYCSFDHQLYPLDPTNPRRIDSPLFMFAMRYFVNMMTDFTPHNADIWTLKDYVAWLRQKGPGGLFYTARMGVGAFVRIFFYAGHFALGRVRRYGQEHKQSLQEEAKKFGVPTERLERVDAMHHIPINRNLSELMRLMFVDRILLIGGALTLALLILMIVTNPWLELAGIVATAILAIQINARMVPRRFLLPGPKQAQAAKKIARLLDVPLVVMGHSHVRRVVDLGRGHKYVNTGCWLPPLAGMDHSDPAQPCTCKLSHLVVEDVAELRVFCRAAKTVRLADVSETKPHLGDEGPDLAQTSDILVR